METETDERFAIKTPLTHPTHGMVGHYFAGSSWATSRTEIYYCDSYDPRIGFWLTNITNPADRKNVSERAVGGTFHEAHAREGYWWVSCWNVKVQNDDLAARKLEVEAAFAKTYAHLDDKALRAKIAVHHKAAESASYRSEPDRELPAMEAEIGRRNRAIVASGT